MKAIQITEFGGPDVMHLVELDTPTPTEGQELINVSAIGINYADTHQTENSYLSPQKLPLVPGIEVVGTTASGLRVLAPVDGGGYAQQAVTHSATMIPIPDGVTDEQALCMLVQGSTAWHILKTVGHLQPGETVVVHAAAGGVGQILCQWANAIGCTVIGTVGSKEKEAIAKKNGCHHVINYTDNNFVEEVEKIVGKNGIDVVYDGVGAKTFEGSIECLKVRGMMVAFGNASGYVHTLDIKKHINAKGLFFTRPSIAHYTVTRKELEDSAAKVFDAILSGKIKVEVFKKYSLSEVKKAHEDLEARLLTGPVVILP